MDSLQANSNDTRNFTEGSQMHTLVLFSISSMSSFESSLAYFSKGRPPKPLEDDIINAHLALFGDKIREGGLGDLDSISVAGLNMVSSVFLKVDPCSYCFMVFRLVLSSSQEITHFSGVLSKSSKENIKLIFDLANRHLISILINLVLSSFIYLSAAE